MLTAGLQPDAQLGTLVSRSMQEKDNGSVELLLVLDGILQVGPDHFHGVSASCKESIYLTTLSPTYQTMDF